MNIGIIDGDQQQKKIFNYPNLSLMKISAYHKFKGDAVALISYDDATGLFRNSFDKIYLSKVFTKPKLPSIIANDDGIIKGGTGLFFDKAESLPYEIEHHMPDYNLYKNIYNNINQTKLKNFTEFSIGFYTRGCVRQCSFCVNRNSKEVYRHHNLTDFVDEKRKAIMLWDDNIIAYKKFNYAIAELNDCGKPFVFKQGMDFRLLTPEKMKVLFNSNYYSSNNSKGTRIFHFAFDNIKDYKLMQKKLKYHYENVKKYSYKTMFYVLTGYDFNGKYDSSFFKADTISLMERIKLLFKYNAYPYIMEHENLILNPNVKVFNKLRILCNTPMLITNKTLRDAAEQSKFTKMIDYFDKVDKSFLNIKFNSKLYENTT